MLWAAGVLVRGSEAIWRFLFRRRRSPASGDPAEELRRRLAEVSEREDEPEPTLAAADEQVPAADDLDDLRRSVHARARALTEEMRGANEDE
jgi:acetyl-CoA carboxylase carboxyltransferase component